MDAVCSERRALYVPSWHFHPMLMLWNGKHVLMMPQAQNPATEQAVAKVPEADNSLGSMHGQTAKPLNAEQVLSRHF